MADFPDYTVRDNSTRVTQVVTITPDAFDGNNPAKTAQQKVVEQQWRDALRSQQGAQHPLALNRDAPEVTNDPYTA